MSTLSGARARQGKFHYLRDVNDHDRQAQLGVAETALTLHRPAQKNVNDRRYERPGRPLPVRYVVVQRRDPLGVVLAPWMLLSNVPHAWARAAMLAFCYDWRGRIESCFKLLKSHGQQLEYWQQETALAVARRLLVAAMAGVTVWHLQADDWAAALDWKSILVRLRGRQTKRHRPHTAPALLAGLWVLLSMRALLEHYDLDRLRTLAAQLPYHDTG